MNTSVAMFPFPEDCVESGDSILLVPNSSSVTHALKCMGQLLFLFRGSFCCGIRETDCDIFLWRGKDIFSFCGSACLKHPCRYKGLQQGTAHAHQGACCPKLQTAAALQSAGLGLNVGLYPLDSITGAQIRNFE